MNDRSIQRTSTQAVPPAQELGAATDATVIGGPRDVRRTVQAAETGLAEAAAEKMRITELRKNDPPQLLADFVDPGNGTRSGA